MTVTDCKLLAKLFYSPLHVVYSKNVKKKSDWYRKHWSQKKELLFSLIFPIAFSPTQEYFIHSPSQFKRGLYYISKICDTTNTNIKKEDSTKALVLPKSWAWLELDLYLSLPI